MKKKVKLLLVLMVMILLTGCAKVNTTMDITTKDVKLTIILACKEAFKDQLKLTDEQIDNYAKQKYFVEDYNENGYVGYKITKSLGKLSSLKGAKKYAIISMQKYIMAEKDASKQMFNSILGVYSARFSFSDDLSSFSGTNNENSSEEQKELLKNIEYKFTVTLPSRVLSTNATEVSEDKKTLTWDLSKEQEVKFTFTPYLTIAIVIGSIILLLVIYSIFATWIDGLRGKTRGFKSKVKSSSKNSDSSPLGPMLVKNRYNNNASETLNNKRQEGSSYPDNFYQEKTQSSRPTYTMPTHTANAPQTSEQDLFYSIQPTASSPSNSGIETTPSQSMDAIEKSLNTVPTFTQKTATVDDKTINTGTVVYNDTNMMNGYKGENEVVSFRKEEPASTFKQEYAKEQNPATELEQMGVSSDILGRNTNNDQYMDDNMDN